MGELWQIEFKADGPIEVEVVTAMLAEQPDNAIIWYGLARGHFKLENWAEASKSLKVRREN